MTSFIFCSISSDDSFASEDVLASSIADISELGDIYVHFPRIYQHCWILQLKNRKSSTSCD